MKSYIGTKIVKAEPCKAWEDAGSHQIGDEGYQVIYDDGYESWSPKDVFEKSYRRIGGELNTVTQCDVDNFIIRINVSTVGEKTTLVVATLANGFEITESSSCVDAKNYNQELGAEICVNKIKDKVWFLLGFLLQTANGYVKK